MLPSAHFFSGVAIFAIMNIFNVLPKSMAWLSLIIVCSVIPDLDIALSYLHRNLFTHTPFFWGVVVTLIIAATNWSMWIIMPPIFFHLFLDTIDYGLMVTYPFSRKRYGLALLGKDSASETKAVTSYWKEYLSNRRMLCAEFVILLVSLLLLIGVTVRGLF